MKDSLERGSRTLEISPNDLGARLAGNWRGLGKGTSGKNPTSREYITHLESPAPTVFRRVGRSDRGYRPCCSEMLNGRVEYLEHNDNFTALFKPERP